MPRRRRHRGLPRSAYRSKSTRHDDPSIPRSIVVAKGTLSPSARTLLRDIRRMMLPYTAMKLKQSKSNVIKDFVAAASVLKVSHLFMLKQNKSGLTTLTLGQLPKGPTLHWEILRYSLAADVQRKKVNKRDFIESPVMVLNGLRNATPETDGVSADEMAVASAMLGRVYPTVNAEHLSADSCRRVVLFSRNKAQGVIEMRHYSVIRKTPGVSTRVKRLINRAAHLNLSRNQSGAEALLGMPDDDGDDEDMTETAAPTRSGAPRQLAVSVTEIGPRLTLRLLSVSHDLQMEGKLDSDDKEDEEEGEEEEEEENEEGNDD